MTHVTVSLDSAPNSETVARLLSMLLETLDGRTPCGWVTLSCDVEDEPQELPQFVAGDVLSVDDVRILEGYRNAVRQLLAQLNDTTPSPTTS